MACKQIFTRHLEAATVSTSYIGPSFGHKWATTAPLGAPWQTAGVMKNLWITLLSAPGSGKSWSWTLVLNGSDTALTITIADLATTGSDTTHSIAVAVGDLLYWRRNSSGTPTTARSRISIEFWNTTTFESGYGSIDSTSISSTVRTSLFNLGQFNTGNGGVNNFEVLGAAGTVTSVSYKLHTAPGAAKSYLITIYKNNVAQDGSGGTPDTRVTISGASSTTGAWTGTLTIAAGDTVYIECAPTGTPTAAEIGVGVKFIATTDGESQATMSCFANLPTSNGTYFSRPNQYHDTWETSENATDALNGAVSAFTLRAARAKLGSAQTISTGPIVMTFRKNGADTALTMTMSSGQSSASDLTHSVVINPTDLWDFQLVVSGNPGAAKVLGVGFVQYALWDVVTTGSFAIGYKGSIVAASRAGIVSLDGGTNINNEVGLLALFGNLKVVGDIRIVDGRSIPATIAGYATLFIDTADGDLKVIFGDGTIKTIVTDT